MLLKSILCNTEKHEHVFLSRAVSEPFLSNHVNLHWRTQTCLMSFKAYNVTPLHDQHWLVLAKAIFSHSFIHPVIHFRLSKQWMAGKHWTEISSFRMKSCHSSNYINYIELNVVNIHLIKAGYQSCKNPSAESIILQINKRNQEPSGKMISQMQQNTRKKEKGRSKTLQHSLLFSLLCAQFSVSATPFRQ